MNCGQPSQPITLNQLWVRPLPHQNIHLILGLSFLFTQDRSVLLTKDYVIFLSNTIIALFFLNTHKRFALVSVMISPVFLYRLKMIVTHSNVNAQSKALVRNKETNDT